jgi:hypothetical protein
MNPLLTSSLWYFENMLAPALWHHKEARKVVKLQYRNTVDAMGRVNGDEYMLLKTPKTTSRFGFEPYYLRLAGQDQPARIIESWLLPIAQGKLHPSIFAYLLSPAHQQDVKMGIVRGFKPLVKTAATTEGPEKPSDKLDSLFKLGVKIDDDVRKTAKNAPEHKKLDILAVRPHLLDEKPK